MMKAATIIIATIITITTNKGNMDYKVESDYKVRFSQKEK